jgi:hypothetical protein
MVFFPVVIPGNDGSKKSATIAPYAITLPCGGGLGWGAPVKPARSRWWKSTAMKD